MIVGQLFLQRKLKMCLKDAGRGVAIGGADVYRMRGSQGSDEPYRLQASRFWTEQGCQRVIAIHLRDETELNLFRADRFAGASDSTVAELLGVHLLNHAQDAPRLLGFALREQI